MTEWEINEVYGRLWEAEEEIARLKASLKEIHEAHHQLIDMLGEANKKLAKYGEGPLANDYKISD